MSSEFNKPPPPKERFCPPVNTSLNLQGKSPFNAFVTNELSPLTQTGNNSSKNIFSRPIKKFSFSEQIHDFVLQEPGTSQFVKEKDNLESFFNEDNGYSPLLSISKLHRQSSLNYNIEESNPLTEIVNNKNSNIIENMLDPIHPSPAQDSVKKSTTMHPLINYTPVSESDLNYKTPTFCHNPSTNSDEYSYKSPKFAGTPQNSFHLDSTPQRSHLKSENSSADRINEGDKLEKDHLDFTGCNCKKSKCLKLYCECFANEKFCIKGCNCLDCKNNVQNQDLRKKAMNSILIKNPQAFASKMSARKDVSPLRTLDQKTLFNKRGCNCKKSNCRKKYCECYGVGLKCSDICKCEDCKNNENSTKKPNSHNNQESDESIDPNISLMKKAKRAREESEEKKAAKKNQVQKNTEEIEPKPKKKKRKS